MAELTYLGLISLDGYLADADGNFGWAAPDEDVHRFVNDLVRPVGTYLYGRRMYEVMRYWETAHTEPGQTDYALDFARIWQAADKIVYSSTMPAVSTAKTRLEREFEPDAVRQLKATADRDLSIGGAGIAAHAIAAGLVDEWHLFLTPVLVGGGTPFLPDGVNVNLELLDERRFANGVVFLRYRTA